MHVLRLNLLIEKPSLFSNISDIIQVDEIAGEPLHSQHNIDRLFRNVHTSLIFNINIITRQYTEIESV